MQGSSASISAATTSASIRGRFESAPEHRSLLGSWWTASAVLAFLAGFLTPFTVSLVGEMPVGEVILVAIAGWTALCVIFNRTWPGPLLRGGYFWAMMAGQAVALGAYIFSDLYRQSFPRDMARGWARMVFLAIDIIALAYLFGQRRQNFLVFVVAQALGTVVSAYLTGPLFGDMWKFGVGVPLTCLAFAVAPAGGRLAGICVAVIMGFVHFKMDFRSYGMMCLLAAAMLTLTLFSPRFRVWLAPIGLAIMVLAGGLFYTRSQQLAENRATRSNVERSSMMQAAAEAFQESPLIGHGSWFSNSHVYENFLRLRQAAAKEARVGGFADPRKDDGGMAIHSQILVALAEGGLFGAAFFFVFLGGLLWGLAQLIFVLPWDRWIPLQVLILLSAGFNLLFSPFSGAHRVYIAMAAGLVLLIAARRAKIPQPVVRLPRRHRSQPTPVFK